MVSKWLDIRKNTVGDNPVDELAEVQIEAGIHNFNRGYLFALNDVKDALSTLEAQANIEFGPYSFDWRALLNKMIKDIENAET